MTDGGRTDGGKWKIVQCSVGPETAKNPDSCEKTGSALKVLRMELVPLNKVHREETKSGAVWVYSNNLS